MVVIWSKEVQIRANLMICNQTLPISEKVEQTLNYNRMQLILGKVEMMIYSQKLLILVKVANKTFLMICSLVELTWA